MKTWEMEASHKPDLTQWRTIEHGNYSIQANGGEKLDGEDAAKVGNYNALMADSKEYKKCKLQKNLFVFENSFKILAFAFQSTLEMTLKAPMLFLEVLSLMAFHGNS